MSKELIHELEELNESLESDKNDFRDEAAELERKAAFARGKVDGIGYAMTSICDLIYEAEEELRKAQIAANADEVKQ